MYHVYICVYLGGESKIKLKKLSKHLFVGTAFKCKLDADLALSFEIII